MREKIYYFYIFIDINIKIYLINMKVKVLAPQSCPTLLTPWTVACQAPLSLGFPRQEYWHGLPFPSPGDLSNPGIERGSPVLQADSLPTETLR